jgi:tRNA dimethylallyltransferase
MSKRIPPGSGSSRPPLALIAGPTASGKTDLAVNLALALQSAGKRAVIINADSAQVYSDLRILSARPAPEETQGIEHRLFGAWDGARPCSAADWADAARREIAQLHDEGAIPILAGGTGLYLRTLLDGIAPIPEIEPAIREAVRKLPTAEAYAALELADPPRAALLHSGDTTRIARALEVVKSTGKPLSHWQELREGGIGDMIALHPLLLLPPREWLYERCDRRFAAMLDKGAAEEVERLLQRKLEPDLPVMRAIGVREITGWIRGECSREEALTRGAQATRNYAKRQYTWFRGQIPDNWPISESSNFSKITYFDILLQS